MGTTESLKLAVPLLMARMTQLLQRTLVLGDLPQPLCQKFTRFFQAVPLPPYCFGFTNCLNVAPWDHRLLTTVLRGQNITGPRRRSGKKEFLWEVFAVVRARVERLEGLGQYRELVRYLKAVKCEDSVGLRDLRDKVPFYLCKCGDFTGAAYALLSPVNTLACCTACRLTPAHFESYLKMLWTGGVPAGNDIQDTGHWTVSVGEEPGALVSPRRSCPSPGVAVKPWILMKQALRMLFGNQALYQNARCWSALLALWGSSPVLEQSGLLTMLTLQAPSFSFQKKVLRASDAILQELRLHGNATLPADLFFGPLGLEACLLLCTQAAREMLVTEFPWLTSLLDIVLAFGKNLWALKVFLEGVSKTPAIYEVIGMISRDLSYQKYTLLRLWQILGPDYVGELLCLLLGFRSIDLQTPVSAHHAPDGPATCGHGPGAPPAVDHGGCRRCTGQGGVVAPSRVSKATLTLPGVLGQSRWTFTVSRPCRHRTWTPPTSCSWAPWCRLWKTCDSAAAGALGGERVGGPAVGAPTLWFLCVLFSLPDTGRAVAWVILAGWPPDCSLVSREENGRQGGLRGHVGTRPHQARTGGFCLKARCRWACRLVQGHHLPPMAPRQEVGCRLCTFLLAGLRCRALLSRGPEWVEFGP
ncbi:uncharacterized protein LOC111820014 [Trichechus manatus latirostris]|uniref:Uncharacterized protein LOC111820014 n=1 Tax=Trichechus manatus latirostris TaxID=127582 RepID=A0A2Y9QQP6_TRIMA|nr:uncharacterized protein LOC111820014 [Trichechus manatus latirostris]